MGAAARHALWMRATHLEAIFDGMAEGEPLNEDVLPSVLRDLIVSPELVSRLRTLFGRTSPSQTAELSIPAAEVVARLLSVELDLGATAELALELVVRATHA